MGKTMIYISKNHEKNHEKNFITKEYWLTGILFIFAGNLVLKMNTVYE